MANHHLTLKKIIDTALPILEQMDPAILNEKKSTDSWSKKEIIGHLIDSAYNNHRRFLLSTQQNNLVFDGYTQDNWVIKNQYQKRPIKELLNIWYSTNLHMTYLIGQMSEDFLFQTTKDHNFHHICMNLLQEGEETSISYLIWDYIFHLEHHLQQIIDNYQPINPTF